MTSTQDAPAGRSFAVWGGNEERFGTRGCHQRTEPVLACGWSAPGHRQVARTLASCALALVLGGLCGLCLGQWREIDRAEVRISSRLGAALQQDTQLRNAPAPRRAFAMMSYDPPGAPPGESFWGAVALARALQRLSRYPLILLTNTTELADGTVVSQALRKLNVRVQPLHKVDVPRDEAWTFKRWNIAFWKLQVFRLTEYDKIIWLDSDSMIYRSIDWIFDKPGMWAQRDDWWCLLNQTAVCSGLLSLAPSEEDFQGLMYYAAKVGSTLTLGDQQLISMYFENVVRKPVHLLDDSDAAFGQCIGAAPSIFGGVSAAGRGWNTPAFVHKSAGWGNTNNNVYSNVCFTHNVSRQRYVMDDTVINACHFHSLAAFWRTMFCEANEILEVRLDTVRQFCDDPCYYTGSFANGSSCAGEHTLAPELACEIDGTTGRRDPVNLLPALADTGVPAPELIGLPETPSGTPDPAQDFEVELEVLNMTGWSCGGRCPRGSCCDLEDCQRQCFDNPEFNESCSSFHWVDEDFACHLFRKLRATYSHQGGHSGPDMAHALRYKNAKLPDEAFTIMARIRSTSQNGCQDIIAWGDGIGTWMSVEFRLAGGRLLYGENPADAWKELATEDLGLADGVWHEVVAVRHQSGNVSLFANGALAAEGAVAGTVPTVLPIARSARVAHLQDCVFEGDVAHVRIYDTALDIARLFAAPQVAAS